MTYPIAPQVFGHGRACSADHVDQFSAWTLLESGETVQVELVPSFSDPTQWTITGPLGGFGRILIDDYPDFQRITESGLKPSATALLRHDDDQLAVDILLPAPPFAVPVNNLPSGTRVFPPGATHPVDLESADSVRAHNLDAMSPVQVLVTLQKVGAHVVAMLDGTLLGSVPTASFEAEGPVAARCYAAEGACVIDADFEAEPSESLPELRLAPRPEPVVATTEWHVTITGEEIPLDR